MNLSSSCEESVSQKSEVAIWFISLATLSFLSPESFGWAPESYGWGRQTLHAFPRADAGEAVKTNLKHVSNHVPRPRVVRVGYLAFVIVRFRPWCLHLDYVSQSTGYMLQSSFLHPCLR